MPKDDGYSRTVEGHLAALDACRYRRLLLARALEEIASGAREPTQAARDALDVDGEMALMDPREIKVKEKNNG